MIDLGKVRPGKTIRFPFNTFDSNDPSQSVTATGIDTGAIQIYKDGSLTQRASTSGYAVDADVDTIVGRHWIEIDLADNDTAGFFVAGSEYLVAVDGLTIDAGSVNGFIARFEIGYHGAVHETSLATLASQTSFTLTAGSADKDAYNGWTAIIHDVASAIQIAAGVVGDYVGATKTVTLNADPGIFTMAPGDNISLFPPTNVHGWNAVALATTNPLPNAVAGATNGLFIAGTNAATTVTTSFTTTFTGNLTGSVGSVTGAVGSVAGNVDGSTASVTGAVGSVTGAVGSVAGNVDGSVASVVDKTGFSLSTVGILAIWHQLTSAIVTASTIGKLLKDNIDTTISSRHASGAAVASVTGAVGSVTGAVGSVTAEVTADVTKVSGSAAAADKLEAHAMETLPVTFSARGTTTTAVLNQVDGAAASSTDDKYKSRVLVFNAGTLDHEVAEITAYEGSSKTATISAVTTAVVAAHTARMI